MEVLIYLIVGSIFLTMILVISLSRSVAGLRQDLLRMTRAVREQGHQKPPHAVNEIKKDVELPAFLLKEGKESCHLLVVHVCHHVGGSLEFEVAEETVRLTDYQSLPSPERPLCDMESAELEMAYTEIALEIERMSRTYKKPGVRVIHPHPSAKPVDAKKPARQSDPNETSP